MEQPSTSDSNASSSSSSSSAPTKPNTRSKRAPKTGQKRKSYKSMESQEVENTKRVKRFNFKSKEVVIPGATQQEKEEQIALHHPEIADAINAFYKSSLDSQIDVVDTNMNHLMLEMRTECYRRIRLNTDEEKRKTINLIYRAMLYAPTLDEVFDLESSDDRGKKRRDLILEALINDRHLGMPRGPLNLLRRYGISTPKDAPSPSTNDELLALLANSDLGGVSISQKTEHIDWWFKGMWANILTYMKKINSNGEGFGEGGFPIQDVAKDDTIRLACLLDKIRLIYYY